MERLFSGLLTEEMPDGWTSNRLGTCLDLLRNGLGFQQNQERRGVRVTRIETISDGVINTEKVGFVETERDISEYLLHRGDVLFSHINSIKHIGKVAQFDNDEELYHGMNLLVLRFNSTVDKQFGYYFLASQQTKSVCERMAKQAVNQASINTKELRQLPITLPPLSEQHKIAEILSTVDETIEKTDAVIEETQQLKKGLMQKLFVNEAFMVLRKAKEEETDLKPMAIHELGEIVTGITPSTTVREYYDNPEYMFIGPADIGQSKRIVKSANYISKEGFAVSRQLPYNAVMVVGIGATIGKVGITSEPCTTNQQINTIIPNTREFPADYVYYLLVGISHYVLAFAGQTATPILNKGDFGNMLTFIHPTLDERHKIADILSEVDAKIEKEQAFKSELEQLKKGLMQVLLTGKVRVKV